MPHCVRDADGTRLFSRRALPSRMLPHVLSASPGSEVFFRAAKACRSRRMLPHGAADACSFVRFSSPCGVDVMPPPLSAALLHGFSVLTGPRTPGIAVFLLRPADASAACSFPFVKSGERPARTTRQAPSFKDGCHFSSLRVRFIPPRLFGRSLPLPPFRVRRSRSSGRTAPVPLCFPHDKPPRRVLHLMTRQRLLAKHLSRASSEPFPANLMQEPCP